MANKYDPFADLPALTNSLKDARKYADTLSREADRFNITAPHQATLAAEIQRASDLDRRIAQASAVHTSTSAIEEASRQAQAQVLRHNELFDQARRAVESSQILRSMLRSKAESFLGVAQLPSVEVQARLLSDTYPHLNNLRATLQTTQVLDSAGTKAILAQIGQLASMMELSSLKNATIQWAQFFGDARTSTNSLPPLFVKTVSALAQAETSQSQDADAILDIINKFIDSILQQLSGPLSASAKSFILNVVFLLIGMLDSRWLDSQNSKEFAKLNNLQVQTQSKLDDIDLQLKVIAKKLDSSSENTSDSAQSQRTTQTKANANLYIEPRVSSSMVLKLYPATPVEIVSLTECWAEVRTVDFISGQMVTGWLQEEHLQNPY